jgi:hypothetical protein
MQLQAWPLLVPGIVALSVAFVFDLPSLALPGFVLIGAAIHLYALVQDVEVDGAIDPTNPMCTLVPDDPDDTRCEDDEGLLNRIMKVLLVYCRIYGTVIFTVLYSVILWNAMRSVTDARPVIENIFAFLSASDFARVFVAGLTSIAAIAIVIDDGGLARRDEQRRIHLVIAVVLSSFALQF